MTVRIGVDDPRKEDVRRLLERHLAYAYQHSPPEHVHALDVDALLGPSITFFSARDDGRLVAVGALKELGASHGELKSMHTAEAVRGQGVGRAMLDHLIDEARRRGYRRVSLETGTMEPFAGARSLYVNAGFTTCEPFGEYTSNPHSVCMTIALDGPSS
jgi:putative acetyltransferase